MRLQRRGSVVLGFALAATMASPAWGHAFGQRYDLPLPLGFYLAAAGLAVALSFLGSILFLRPGSGRRWEVGIAVPSRLAVAVHRGGSAAAVILLALILATALAGPQAPTSNLATVFVWVIWWIGFVLAAALVADLWTPLNPFAALANALGPAALRRAQAPLPRWAGWASVLGLLAIAWLELVSEWSESPRALAAIIGLYMAGLLLGALVFGRGAWFAAADPVSRLFGLLGQMAPVAFGREEVRLRLPGSGLAGGRFDAISAVFVVTLIGIILFDGISETPAWAAVLDWITRSQGLRPWLLELRGAGVDLLKLVRTVGLVATVLLANLLYLALAAVVWWAGERQVRLHRIFAGFAASLLPIAVAYHLAHYVSYLALAGQLAISIASDPFGLGWDLFGTARRSIDLGVVTAERVWWIASVALVAGHALSVLVAHGEALRLYTSSRAAIRSQLPMMAFMVGLTTLSLWILSQPIVE